ncbi:MAG: hypothetical protein GVY18_14565 [Bacteroidetes bacterium]|jgi:uncharacterized tellurite resistance protein B-like protein|nr:hypothetical protein [Bacteroidota bacterium]
MAVREHPPLHLSHLALIYLALAHGADEALDDAEVDLIAERLRHWQDQDVGQGTVLGALKEALERYAESGRRSHHLDAAIQAVRDCLPDDARRRLLQDLMDLARADDRVVFGEAQLLGRLAHAWDILSTTTDARLWNVLNEADEDGWTPVHDLAVTYVALAHATDDRLSSDEIDAIQSRLAEWLPEADSTVLLGVLREALSAYGQADDPQAQFRRSVEAVRRVMPRHQRAALLIDLYHVAKADGVLLDAEQAVIDDLSEAWGIALDAG